MFNKRIKTEDNVDINKTIGTNLRFIRTISGKNQTRLGQALNITFQQVQKYEGGKNGMSAYRLYKAAKYLNVPMEAFFDPKYIEKMRSVHQADDLSPGRKPNNFFNVYKKIEEQDEEYDRDLLYDISRGYKPSEEEKKYLQQRYPNAKNY